MFRYIYKNFACAFYLLFVASITLMSILSILVLIDSYLKGESITEIIDFYFFLLYSFNIFVFATFFKVIDYFYKNNMY
jgi:hypothetical protein